MTANQIEEHVLQETLEEHPAWEAEEKQGDKSRQVLRDLQKLQDYLKEGFKGEIIF